nr:unnamed protein product [Spirometra erinaceieuropaei]
MRDAWTPCKAKEIQGYANRNEWENVFVAIRAVYGPTTKANAFFLSASEMALLAEKVPILKRWAGHFGGVLSRSSTTYDAVIVRLRPVETNVDLELPPSLHETTSSASAGKRPDRMRFMLKSASTVAPNLWDTAGFQ